MLKYIFKNASKIKMRLAYKCKNDFHKNAFYIEMYFHRNVFNTKMYLSNFKNNVKKKNVYKRGSIKNVFKQF